MHTATAIMTGSANQRPNTPCVQDVNWRRGLISYLINTPRKSTNSVSYSSESHCTVYGERFIPFVYF